MARFVIAGCTFLLGVALLTALAVREGAIPTVAAADLETDEYHGGEVFIDGEVTEIQQMKNPTRFLFICKRGGSRPMQIETREVLSDTFEVGSPVRLKGRYDPGSKEFHASYIDTKCPSKYEESPTGTPPPASSP